jgi:hypothetical protein
MRRIGGGSVRARRRERSRSSLTKTSLSQPLTRNCRPGPTSFMASSRLDQLAVRWPEHPPAPSGPFPSRPASGGKVDVAQATAGAEGDPGPPGPGPRGTSAGHVEEPVVVEQKTTNLVTGGAIGVVGGLVGPSSPTGSHGDAWAGNAIAPLVAHFTLKSQGRCETGPTTRGGLSKARSHCREATLEWH